MKISVEQKVKAYDAVAMTGYLNKEYQNWQSGRESNPDIIFKHENEKVNYTARFNDAIYDVLYYTNEPYMSGATFKNDDGSIMTMKRVEGGYTDTRYECDVNSDGVVDYSFYLERDENGNVLRFKEDENGDGKFDYETKNYYENGKLTRSDSYTRDPESNRLMYESTSKYFGDNPSFGKNEQETLTYYDIEGKERCEIIQLYNEAGQILERVYNDVEDDSFWSRIFGPKGSHYRVEYDYDAKIASYYNSKGELTDTKPFEENNIPL